MHREPCSGSAWQRACPATPERATALRRQHEQMKIRGNSAPKLCASGELVGFVAGTADAQAHFRSFYRRNLLVLVSIVCWKVLTNRTVRRRILERMAHIRAALQAMIPGAKRPATATISDKGPKTQCPLRLLTIAVAPEARGSGVASQVMQAFEDKLRTAGHQRVGLSVLPDNARAIAFYKKCGWDVTHASKAGVWFEKDL